MANSKGILVWIAGGAGVFLLYSAVSNKTPSSLLLSYLGGGTPTPFPTAAGGSDTNYQDPLFGPAPPKSMTTPLKPGQLPDTGSKGPQYLPDGSQLLSYHDPNQVYDLIDANGRNLGAIPAAYQNNPNAFVPPPGGMVQSA